jgi:hypothetical protein
MDVIFREHVDALHGKVEPLLRAQPVAECALPRLSLGRTLPKGRPAFELSRPKQT